LGSDARSPHFGIQRLAPGVWVALARPDGQALCNAGIVDLGGRTLVFDAMLTPVAGAALRRAARRVTGRDPDWVVNSHWHGDHIWGNAALRAPHVVSTRTVRRVIERRSREQWRECRRVFPKELKELDRAGSPVSAADRRRLTAWFRGVLDGPRDLPIVPPDVTFEETLVLTGARRSIELLSYGGGHSPSDVFAHLPDERTIFAGDLAMVGLHPSVGDGWPDRWMSILRRMEALGAERVLPGHGPVGDRRTLPTVRRYLGDVTALAGRARRAGRSVAEAAAVPVPERYRNWQFAFMFGENVARAYRLAGGRRRRASG
jgi:cyclase